MIEIGLEGVPKDEDVYMLYFPPLAFFGTNLTNSHKNPKDEKRE